MLIENSSEFLTSGISYLMPIKYSCNLKHSLYTCNQDDLKWLGIVAHHPDCGYLDMGRYDVR